MDILLLKTIKNLGEIGSKVSVKSGYARNFLIPTNQAVLPTKANLAKVEEQKQELLKLSLYNNFTDDGKNIITSEAVKSCILDSAKTSLDQLIFALCRGSHKDLNSIFPKLLGQGLTTIEILRATQRHFTRLYFVVGELNSGQNYDYIITKLTPPIFFKYKSDFKKQTQAWSLSTIKQALSILLDCEIKSKQINNSSEVLCSRALLKITQMGKKLT